AEGPSPHYRLWVVVTSVQDASSGTAREELALGNAETGKARRFSTTTVIHARDGDGAFWDLSLSVECVKCGPIGSTGILLPAGNCGLMSLSRPVAANRTGE